MQEAIRLNQALFMNSGEIYQMGNILEIKKYNLGKKVNSCYHFKKYTLDLKPKKFAQTVQEMKSLQMNLKIQKISMLKQVT